MNRLPFESFSFLQVIVFDESVPFRFFSFLQVIVFDESIPFGIVAGVSVSEFAIKSSFPFFGFRILLRVGLFAAASGIKDL